jgi:ADP-dependent NAD(P)H-hydrate dehydratase / NAD(P)H-hydrate epimerase
MALPVVTAAQMRRWESASWAAGRTEGDVIRTVGRCVAERVLALSRAGDAVLIVAGRGHNGDDARAAAGRLQGRGVELVNIVDPVADLEPLKRALARRPAWVIDGLFGIGLNRPLDAAWTAVIGAINAAGRPVAAVDLPSGLDADTGLPQGAAVRAAVTLTVAAPKAGLCRSEAFEYTGRVEPLADVGLAPWSTIWKESDPEIGAWWSEAADFAEYPPLRRVDSHKGDYGHLVIFAGSAGYHGAAVLAARGAMRARPGLITVMTSPETLPAVSAQLAAPMVRAWGPTFDLPPKITAIVVGPGLAAANLPPGLRDLVQGWWKYGAFAMVGDASALDWLRDTPPSRNHPRVRTPHPGEAGRMLGIGAPKDRWEAVRRLGAASWAVLKGYQTLVFGPGAPLWINGTGNPGLAQGGSGDVLAGFIGGLLASPILAADPAMAVRYAVWRHGAAADRLEQAGSSWSTEELAAAL